MLTILFGILAVICAYKWLFWRVTTAVMLWYIQETGNLPPFERENERGLPMGRRTDIYRFDWPAKKALIAAEVISSAIAVIADKE
ncbi:MAG: hypothetical protein HFF14_05845 [Angelakisella sp.]|nr:hypothetical protein [Angelakisella sp.]